MASPGRNTLIVIQRMDKAVANGWYESHIGNALCHWTQLTYKDILIHGATKQLISIRDEAITQRINSDKLHVDSSFWFRKPVEPMTSRHMWLTVTTRNVNTPISTLLMCLFIDIFYQYQHWYLVIIERCNCIVHLTWMFLFSDPHAK